MQLSQFSHQLEIAGKENKLAGAAEWVTQAEASYETVKPALEKFLEGETYER
jgi:hypothetical protein